MAHPRRGEYLVCNFCGDTFYRQRSHITRGIKKSCGKPECKSKAMSGANNPFWGKKHSPETIAQINASLRARPYPRKKGGPPKGWKPTPEMRAKMSAALRERWRTNRDKMLAKIPRGENHCLHKVRSELRYRRNFTNWQKREWQGDKCFYCESTEELVLDHIISVMAGGTNRQANAQTLCMPCNRWKLWFVDRPFHIAALDSKQG